MQEILIKIILNQDLNEDEQESIFVLLLDNYLNNYSPMEQYFAKFNIEHFLDGYVSHEKAKPSDFFISNIQTFLSHYKVKQDIALYAEIAYFICRFLNQKECFNTSRKLCLAFLEIYKETDDIESLTMHYLKYFSSFDEKIHMVEPSDQEAMEKADKFSKLAIEKGRTSLSGNFLTDPLEPIFGSTKGIKRDLLAKFYYKNRHKLP